MLRLKKQAEQCRSLGVVQVSDTAASEDSVVRIGGAFEQVDQPQTGGAASPATSLDGQDEPTIGSLYIPAGGAAHRPGAVLQLLIDSF